MIDFSYFFFIGVFDLLILTFQDIRGRTVDDRFNWIMLGVSFSIIYLKRPELFFILALVAVSLIIRYTGKKILAEGDLNALSWITFGLAALDVNFFIVFYFWLVLLLIHKHIFIYALDLIDFEMPGFPIIAGAFIITTVNYFNGPTINIIGAI